MNFFDIRYAQSRLQGGLIMLGGEPIFVENVEEGGRNKFKLFYTDLIRNDSSFTFYPSPDIDFKPVKLGLVNLERGGFLLTQRFPIRAWKIGLTTGNLVLRNVTGVSESGNRYRRADMLKSKQLRNTILGVYPEYDRAFSYARGKKKGIAFSRSFGVLPSGKLVHKDVGRVGRCTKEGPHLDEEFFYFEEELRGSLNV